MFLLLLKECIAFELGVVVIGTPPCIKMEIFVDFDYL